MAITKYFSAKIVKVGELSELKKTASWQGIQKRASVNPLIYTVTVDPVRYLYVVNHSVSAYEYHGPNHNGDGFPETELRERHYTFIGKPVTVDHVSHLVIGTVLDSIYIEPTDPKDPTTGHYVQNLLAIDKKKAERVDPRIVDGIMNGEITDTSMGALVSYSQCSICGNIAHTEAEYCAHIASMKNQKIRTASGETRLVFEICHDFQFFEDSVIRPLHYGGLAGGRGADPKAKILMITASDISTAAQKLPSNVDQLNQTQETNDNEIPDTDDVVKEIERLKKDQPSGVDKGNENGEEEADENEQDYSVETVQTNLEEFQQNRFEEKEPEDKIVVAPSDLFHKVDLRELYEQGELPEGLFDFFKNLIVTSSVEVSPTKEQAFDYIRKLVALGYSVEKALLLAWIKYGDMSDELAQDIPTSVSVIDELLEKICGKYASVSEYVLGEKIVVALKPFDENTPKTCTPENIKEVLSALRTNVVIMEDGLYER